MCMGSPVHSGNEEVNVYRYTLRRIGPSQGR